MNKDRFCKIITKIALIDTSIKRDWRLQTKKLSQPVNQNKQGRESSHKASRANSRLVQA